VFLETCFETIEVVTFHIFIQYWGAHDSKQKYIISTHSMDQFLLLNKQENRFPLSDSITARNMKSINIPTWFTVKG